MSSSGNGLFKRPPSIQIVPNSPQSPHSASVSSSLASTAATSRSATPVSPESLQEPRRRHGSAPSTSTLVFPRRDSAPVSTSTTNAIASRRFSTIESLQLPRKGSDMGIVHKPSPLSPKRKPLPKGSAYEKQDTSQEEELDGKLGKLDIAGGSTMVRTLDSCN